MLRRRAVVACCATAIAALALDGLPAAADAASPASRSQASPVAAVPAPPEPPAGVIEALQRDLGLTAAEATTRLANEHRLGPVESPLRKHLGGRFAGSWARGDTAKLVVATTDPYRARDIVAAGAEARVVHRGLRELTVAKAALDRAAKQRSHPATPLWYVDVRTNSVVVRTSDPARAAAFVAASGVDRTTVRIVESGVRPQALADLRGGDVYYVGGSSRCSIGFPITKGAQGGFVSAGHCGRAGQTTTGYNQAAQGTFQGSSFPGNDYSWVAANSSWTPQPWVKGPSGNVTVAGSTESVEGTSVCRSGSTTGWHCGTVQQRDTSVSYPQGTVTGVTRTNVCAEPGDSGGSFISGSQAQGVASGGSGNCSSGGETYFQPVNEILQAYGLTLKTSGGSDPEPPTGCQHTQHKYSGTLTAGQRVHQPGNSFYQSTASGAHTGCLDGPDGVDFDIYLQKWNGSSWANVAEGAGPGPDESLTYNGGPGYYRYQVHAYSGSGAYALGLSRP
ncbi:S1 family peptidase [Streptomyces sp. H27-D2]|uniref:S1 family peptidase n=1 Tax=Streptomyces sp. H27-D2 TaxID=3046304 RepID=UPI002DBD1CD0|nr:S1 family peptidase [Streptomyces sp. H27-D2]MEC4018729.1 S1 family peptidase [Streptomyces sp. H27-D2]